MRSIQKLAMMGLALILMVNVAVLVMAAPPAADASVCTADCLNGTFVTCYCGGSCSATDGVGCSCTGSGTNGSCTNPPPPPPPPPDPDCHPIRDCIEIQVP